MGQSEDYKTTGRTVDRAFMRRSHTSQSSNGSYSLSESSRGSMESPVTSPSLMDPSRARSLLSRFDKTTSNHCNLCQNWNDLTDRQKLVKVIKTACREPGKIIWEVPTKAVTLQRNSNGSIGFKYKNIQDIQSGEIYTIIFEVFKDGPAFKRVREGDWIQSANGKALHGSQVLSLKSIVMENPTEPVTLIIQRPQEIKCCLKVRRFHPRRSVSQERLSKEYLREWEQGVLERMDSRDSSQASKTSSDGSEGLPRSLEERLSSAAANITGTRLQAWMPRLPCLKVLIAGNKADELATSLLPSAGVAKPLPYDIGKCYQASVTKTSSGYKLRSSSTDRNVWITDLLESVLDDRMVKMSALTDQVELEITAFKSHPLSAYSQHVLYTAHSIFVLQFSCQDFLVDKQSVFLDIQRKLNKIRTYASGAVPVYLVMTAEDSLPIEQIIKIGKSLHQQFSGAFRNQLLYNSSLNLPLFPATQRSSNERLNNLTNRFADLSCHVGSTLSNETEECHILPSDSSNSYSVCYLARNTSLVNSFDVTDLRDHISQIAFEQRFVSDRYPFSYLVHRERVCRLKADGLCYAYKARIKAECRGVVSESELNSLLRFLHNNGDIICADGLGHVAHSSTLPSTLSSNDILLDPCHLLTATKQLTEIPELSEQQDPNFPDAMKHWKALQENFVASSSFLEYVLKKDAESTLLLSTLNLMSLIYPFHQPSSSPTDQHYLVPFFLPHKKPSRLQSQVPYSLHDPRLYNLCLDFHGSIPDGFFMNWLIGLLRRAWQTNGWWSIDSPQVAHLSLANDCEMEVTCDMVNSIVNVAARCSVTYKLQELLQIITSVVGLTSSIPITIGPSCPLAATHQCAIQAGGPGKTHVIDVGGGLAPVPLWCGKQRVDQYRQVSHWLTKPADTVQVSLPSSCPYPVSLQTHIKDLPPDLFNWLCNQLNTSPVDRNWLAIAGILGYKVGQVETFKIQNQSAYDPCRSFLHDWGRLANATLGALVKMLSHDDGGIGRQDIVVDLYCTWAIVP